jgi:hypothetical protein
MGRESHDDGATRRARGGRSVSVKRMMLERGMKLMSDPRVM